MEILVVNRIIDFETNINPSLVSQVSAVSGIGKFYQTYNLWKWGALILALIASFTTIINRVKALIVKLQKHPSLSSSQHHQLLDDDDYETDSISSDDEDEQERGGDGDEEEDEEEEESGTTPFYTSRNWQRHVDEDFRVRGSGDVYDDDEQWQNRNLGLRRRRRNIGDLFSWSELMMTSGKNVVKLWDNLGLGLGLNLEDYSENEFTIYDMNYEREFRKIASIFGRKDESPVFVSASSSPAVIVSAARRGSGRVALGGWDTRIGSRLPAMLAEWRPKLGNIVGIKAGGIEKVLVRDSVSNALTVGDMRKVNSPLDDPTEADVDTWWDADAVIVTEDCLDNSN